LNLHLKSSPKKERQKRSSLVFSSRWAKKKLYSTSSMKIKKDR
jgi:hypothetical protein